MRRLRVLGRYGVVGVLDPPSALLPGRAGRRIAFVAEISTASTSGFPRLARPGNDLWAVWVEPSDLSRIRAEVLETRYTSGPPRPQALSTTDTEMKLRLDPGIPRPRANHLQHILSGSIVPPLSNGNEIESSRRRKGLCPGRS